MNGNNVYDSKISFGTILKHFLKCLICLIVLLHCLDEMPSKVSLYALIRAYTALNLFSLCVYLMVQPLKKRLGFYSISLYIQFIYTCVYLYIYTCICIHACIYIYTRIYKHITLSYQLQRNKSDLLFSEVVTINLSCIYATQHLLYCVFILEQEV